MLNIFNFKIMIYSYINFSIIIKFVNVIYYFLIIIQVFQSFFDKANLFILMIFIIVNYLYAMIKFEGLI
jgi:hypothetical protein